MLFKYTGPVPWMVWEKNWSLQITGDWNPGWTTNPGPETFTEHHERLPREKKTPPQTIQLKNFCAPVDDWGWFHDFGPRKRSSWKRDLIWQILLRVIHSAPLWGTPMKCWIFWTDLGEHLLPFDLLAWYQKSWTFHMVGEIFFWMTGLEFGPIVFGFYLKLDLFESWIYPCFLMNLTKIHVVFFLEHLQVALSPITSITITHSGDVC